MDICGYTLWVINVNGGFNYYLQLFLIKQPIMGRNPYTTTTQGLSKTTIYNKVKKMT